MDIVHGNVSGRYVLAAATAQEVPVERSGVTEPHPAPPRPALRAVQKV